MKLDAKPGHDASYGFDLQSGLNSNTYLEEADFYQLLITGNMPHRSVSLVGDTRAEAQGTLNQSLLKSSSGCYCSASQGHGWSLEQLMGHGKSWHIETLMRQLWGTQGSIRAASFSCGNMRAKKVGPDFHKNEPEAVSGQGQPFDGSVAEGCPCTRAHRGSQCRTDLSVNLLRDAKISQEGKVPSQPARELTGEPCLSDAWLEVHDNFISGIAANEQSPAGSRTPRVAWVTCARRRRGEPSRCAGSEDPPLPGETVHAGGLGLRGLGASAQPKEGKKHQGQKCSSSG
ncbi:hypothetical protein Anapl_04748 [Anas platyrhynchos]|uniref:Uncharacterized protein n=1 Tax=Anas platyrhynchos TaxID=8839 RepID=R0K6C5_ANAPL|nr:hypothetical protein Anapl_04748 [Anas platyrhynchos]